MEHPTGGLTVQIASHMQRTGIRRSPVARRVVGRLDQRTLFDLRGHGCLPTIAVTVTWPALAKLSVTGKLSPCFSARLRPINMMW